MTTNADGTSNETVIINWPMEVERLNRHNNDLRKTVEQTSSSLRRLVRWFDRNEDDWAEEFKTTTEFFDLQEIYDRAKEVLAGKVA